ncbi:hypothetical protein [Aquimarina litoralis]|uniref:hypothetical protein n=1 Tax=Aquimarina litoralis TaxID=584605 RepID=UPI001C560EEF|nr:hypothetical protein [Aquimarina litoralis]MBW1297010.1 hypothetical protein [Aquimarina litoralis]
MRIIVLLALCTFSLAYPQKTVELSDYSFEVEQLTDNTFVSFTKKHLENSQFVMIGEQHGIKEVGEFTNALYNIAQPFGYKTLCIETDAVAAKTIQKVAGSKDPITAAIAIHKEFPFAIPFYNNKDDYTLFTNVIQRKGSIWGIDQTFMVQFRMNFDHLIRTTSNDKLKAKLAVLQKDADAAYSQAIGNKNFNDTYIFKYDETTHQELLQIATDPKEQEILKQLWKTKEIYAYNNLTKEYYKNNNVRGQLMKRNFINYYNQALRKETLPKVIFKLGANHAAKGLTRTNIYDVSNLIHELAIVNDKKSLHYLVMGISGTVATGNPFAPNPVVPFDNIKHFPEELQKIVPTINQKYYVLNLQPLRVYGYGDRFSDAFKKVLFAYDFVVLVKDAEAFKSF